MRDGVLRIELRGYAPSLQRLFETQFRSESVTQVVGRAPVRRIRLERRLQNRDFFDAMRKDISGSDFGRRRRLQNRDFFDAMRKINLIEECAEQIHQHRMGREFFLSIDYFIESLESDFRYHHRLRLSDRGIVKYQFKERVRFSRQQTP